MFKFNTNLIQMMFTDKTEIMIDSSKKLITYTSLKGEKTKYSLAKALESKDKEMIKTEIYTVTNSGKLKALLI